MRHRRTHTRTTRWRYGNKPVRYYKRGKHPHVITHDLENEYISVGLTSSNKSGHHKLRRVYESNGETKYLVHYPTRDKKQKYGRDLGFRIDIDSEREAIKIGEKKLTPRDRQ